MNFDAILLDLKNGLGVDAVFDAEGVCELLMDDSQVISIIKHEEDGYLTLSSVVAAELPDPVNYHLVLDLLDFSLGAATIHEPAIGRDPETGLLIAYQSVVPSSLNTKTFIEIFNKFIAFCVGISRLIEENTSVQLDPTLKNTDVKV